MDFRGHIQIEGCLRQEGIPSSNFAVKPEVNDLPKEGVEYLSIRFIATITSGNARENERTFIESHDILNALGRAGLMAIRHPKGRGPALEFLGICPDTENTGIYNMTFRDANYS